MLTIKEIEIPGYEKVIEGKDPARGLHCFIAIHNSILGPSLGGTRILNYASAEDALNDVLRLAKAMTYKSAIAQDGLGGGKSVIIADPRKKTPELLHAFAEVVDYLQGRYIAAEDVGSTVYDMTTIRQRTPYVAALPSERSSGDPSRFTARGIFLGLQAVAMKLWGTTSLKDRTISIQGLGNVGSKLAEFLFWEEANLIVCDINSVHAHHCAHDTGAVIIPPEEFCDTPCDILSPCALGGVINAETVLKFQCKAVAGGANNQLQNSEQGKQLMERGILYAPDYIINAGGILNAAAEFESGGYNPRFVREKTNHIYDILLDIFHKSEVEHKPTNLVADELAEHNLKNKIGQRLSPIYFKS